MATITSHYAREVATGTPTRWFQPSSLLTIVTQFYGQQVVTEHCLTSRWWRVLALVVAVVLLILSPVLCLVNLACGVTAAAFGCVCVWCFLRGASVEVPCPVSVEATVSKVLGLASEVEINGITASELLSDNERDRAKGIRRWVHRAKLHFGEVKDTPADILCVKRWLAEQMKADDVRDKDARRMIPMVAVLCTVPDRDDIAANMVRQSTVVQHARRLAGPRAVA